MVRVSKVLKCSEKVVAKLVEEEDIWVNFFVNTIKHSGDSKYVLGRVKLGLRNMSQHCVWSPAVDS